MSYRNGEEFYCFICRFQLEYNTLVIEKIFDTQKIANNYLSMKKIFKNPSIGTFWNYHFKFNFRDYEGNQQSCYLKDYYF